MGTRSFAVRGAAVGAALVVGVMAMPALARANILDCETGAACGFYRTEYSGDHLPIFKDERDLRNRPHSGHGNWDNQFSSVLNNRATLKVVWCTGYNFGGEYFITPAGTGKKVLNSTFGNQISSVNFL